MGYCVFLQQNLPWSTLSSSSAASDVYKRQGLKDAGAELIDEISLVSQIEIRKYELLVMRTEFKVGLTSYLSKQSWLKQLGPSVVDINK